jgi:hypothetical protein
VRGALVALEGQGPGLHACSRGRAAAHEPSAHAPAPAATPRRRRAHRPPHRPAPIAPRDKKKKKDKGEAEESTDAAEAAEADGSRDGEDAAEESEDDDEVVWMTDTSAEAVAARAAEQLTNATAAMVTQGNIEAELEKERKKAEREAKKKVRGWGRGPRRGRKGAVFESRAQQLAVHLAPLPLQAPRPRLNAPARPPAPHARRRPRRKPPPAAPPRPLR